MEILVIESQMYWQQNKSHGYRSKWQKDYNNLWLCCCEGDFFEEDGLYDYEWIIIRFEFKKGKIQDSL